MCCTFCLREKEERLCWSTLFWPNPIRGLCNDCSGRLVKIEGMRCSGCSKPGIPVLCQDCQDWKRTAPDSLDGNLSIYNYNECMREMIYQWKYRGDYEVGFSFQYETRQAFQEMKRRAGKDAVIVPIPLSAERLAERGFNQAAMLADFVPGKTMPLLERLDGEKQSKKTREERIASKNPFNMMEKIEKPVILVDDIYTTGATVYKAAAILKKAGSPRVMSLTLVRG